ncbi:MAG TPA: heparan-alpha-glucosaminide N-acetyltransferase [Rubrivivax sp.]
MNAAHERFDRIDALRGAAIVWMAVFHFCFDLNHFGFWSPKQAFYTDPFWTLQRTAILSTFLFCAGLGQAVALEAGQSWPRFWKRWAQVAACAVLVSIGSAFMFPKSWISFGVLHGIAVMLIVCRLAAPVGRGLWLVGLLALLLPWFYRDPAFNVPALSWTGLVTRKPITEDWVPLLPWIGAMLWGLAAGQGLLRRRRAVIAGALPSSLQPLAALGRWSLSFYILHQPVLIGLVLGWRAWRG